MVFDASDAWSVFGGNTQCLAFLLRSYNAPKMHEAIRDDNVRFAAVCPSLLTQIGQQAAAYQAVAVITGQVSSAAGQYSEEIGAADNPDELAVVQDRHALDASGLHQIGYFAESRQLGDADYVTAHDIGDSSCMRLDEFTGQTRIRREPLAPA